MACYEWKVTHAAEGQRIDASIRRFLPEIPPHVLRESFQRRDVKLDGKRVKPDVRVTAGQKVELFCMEHSTPLVDVVYEDDDVLVINKPKGLVVHPAAGHQDDTLVNGLLCAAFVLMILGLWFCFFQTPAIVAVRKEGYTVAGPKPLGLEMELSVLLESETRNEETQC